MPKAVGHARLRRHVGGEQARISRAAVRVVWKQGRHQRRRIQRHQHWRHQHRRLKKRKRG